MKAQKFWNNEEEVNERWPRVYSLRKCETNATFLVGVASFTDKPFVRHDALWGICASPHPLISIGRCALWRVQITWMSTWNLAIKLCIFLFFIKKKI